jgi:DNA-binding transcriptional ArsR family regulator
VSIDALRWAQRVTTGSPGRKIVLMVLADFASEEGYAFPSQARICEVSEQGERTVRRHLADLEEMGLIRRTHRYRKDGTRSSDAFLLMMPAEDQPANLASCATGQSGHDYRPESTELPANMAPLVRPPTGDSLEPPEDPPGEPPLATTTSAGDARASEPDAPADLDPVKAIIRAANRGMKSNPAIGERLKPIYVGAPRDRAVVEEWLARGIPPETCSEVVTRIALKYEPRKVGDQIAAMSYFEKAVLEEHERRQVDELPETEQEKILAAGRGRETPGKWRPGKTGKLAAPGDEPPRENPVERWERENPERAEELRQQAVDEIRRELEGKILGDSVRRGVEHNRFRTLVLRERSFRAEATG